MKEIWIAPTNPKYFDVIEYLSFHDEILIKKNKKRLLLDDTVYIYISNPVKEIRYKGHVIMEKCSAETLDKHPYINNLNNEFSYDYALVKIDTIFKNGTYCYEELKKNGIGQVQLIARASKQIKTYFNLKEDINK